MITTVVVCAKPYQTVRNSRSSYQTNQLNDDSAPERRPPRRRSSFGGSSVNGATSNVASNQGEIGLYGERNYAVGEGHAYGAHRVYQYFEDLNGKRRHYWLN